MNKILMTLAAVSMFGLSWSGAWLVMDALQKDQSRMSKTVEQCRQPMTTVPYTNFLKSYVKPEQHT